MTTAKQCYEWVKTGHWNLKQFQEWAQPAQEPTGMLDIERLDKWLNASLKGRQKRKPLTEWQPIETAPKGPTILLYSFPLNEFSMKYIDITVAWWVSSQITEYWGTAVFFDGRSIVQHVHNPTHWMPLPDAPTPHGIKENT